MSYSRRTCLAIFSPTRLAALWARWECWHPPALGDRSHYMSRCMVRLPILLDKVLLTHWVQFFQSPCFCAIPSTWNARRLALSRSEEHTSELQSQSNLVCRLLL